LAVCGHYQKFLDRAHRRYLSAVKALAEVRRLAVPVLINMAARRKVNVKLQGAGNPEAA
jgi:hypothetical protein